MTEPNANRREVLLAELELHKAEFAALREEILHTIDAQRQSLNLSLIAIGVGLSLTPYLVGQDAYLILLLFPLVFHIILWEMLSSTRSVSHISEYLTDKLIPRVNAILDELGGQRHDVIALGWEIHINALPTSTRELLMASLTPTGHWMPILAIAALLAAYALTINANFHTPSTGEVLLIVINLLLLIWAAVQNTLVARASLEHARQLRQTALPATEKVEPPRQRPATRGRSKK